MWWNCEHLQNALYEAYVHQLLSSKINLKWKKLKTLVTRRIQYFQLGIFSLNSLTHGFIASARTFNLLTHAFNLLTRAFNLPTHAFNLATRAFSLLTCGFELVSRGFGLVFCGFEFVTHRFELVTRVFELVTCISEVATRNLCFTFPPISRLRNNFSQKPTKNIKKSTRYNQRNVCLLEKKY